MTGGIARTTTRWGAGARDVMAGFFHMLAFCHSCPSEPASTRLVRVTTTTAPRRRPRHPPALGLGRRRRRLRDARRRRRVPLGAGRADRAAARRVRLVARPHRLGGLAQPDALRPDLAVRRRPDGPLRRAPGGDLRAAHGRGRQRTDRLHDRALAAHPQLGAGRRARHRVDVDGLRRHHHEPLVRRATWPGQRHPHRRQRDRAAHLPPDRGLAGDQPRVAYGGADGLARGARGGAPRAAVPAQPPGRHGPARLRRHRRRPRPAAAPARRVQCGTGAGRAARRRRAAGPSGCSPAASRSAA